jgi:hypothetical protein
VSPDLDIGLSVQVCLELLLEYMAQSAARPWTVLACVVVRLVWLRPKECRGDGYFWLIKGKQSELISE